MDYGRFNLVHVVPLNFRIRFLLCACLAGEDILFEIPHFSQIAHVSRMGCGVLHEGELDLVFFMMFPFSPCTSSPSLLISGMSNRLRFVSRLRQSHAMSLIRFKVYPPIVQVCSWQWELTRTPIDIMPRFMQLGLVRARQEDVLLEPCV